MSGVTVLWAAVAATLGAAAASFAQLVVDRAEPGRSVAVLREASRCPRCAAPVRAWHVLPVAGFVLLRGHCRVCRAGIGRRHLAGELTVGVLWALSVGWLGLTWWLPPVLLAPVLVLLLHSGAVRGAGPRWWAAAALPPSGIAVLTLGVGASAAGREGLYAACAGVGAAALLGAVVLTGQNSGDRLSQTPTSPHLPEV